jgi:hypothetical protein
MKLPVSIAEKLILLQNGDKVPFSKLKHEVVRLMIDNGILKVQLQGRSKRLISISTEDLLAPFLINHFGIESLTDRLHSALGPYLTDGNICAFCHFKTSLSYRLNNYFLSIISITPNRFAVNHLSSHSSAVLFYCHAVF